MTFLLPVILPDGFISKVSVNDKVAAGDVIAEKKQSGEDNIVNVSLALGTNPKDVPKILRKNLADSISEGELLALKKGRFGVGSKKLLSEFSGTVVKIDEDTGKVYIRALGKSESAQKLFSPVAGTVQVCNNDKIVIKTDKEAVLAKDSLGKEATGELLYIDNFDQNKLSNGVENKIVITKKMDKVSIYKSLVLEAAGIILEEFENTDFVDLSDKNMEIPVMIVGPDDFKKLIKLSGKRAYLNGADKSILML